MVERLTTSKHAAAERARRAGVAQSTRRAAAPRLERGREDWAPDHLDRPLARAARTPQRRRARGYSRPWWGFVGLALMAMLADYLARKSVRLYRAAAARWPALARRRNQAAALGLVAAVLSATLALRSVQAAPTPPVLPRPTATTAVAAAPAAPAAPPAVRLTAVPAAAGAAPSCVPPPPYSQQLGAIVEAEIGRRQGSYGVAVMNLYTGEAYLRDADRRFPAASVYKLAVLYEAQRQIQAGTLSPTTTLTITPADAVEPEPEGGPELGATVTVDEALEAMVTHSSNAAAHALMRILGRDAVNRSTQALGLRDTLVSAPGWSTGLVDRDGDELAVTSPRDILCFLTLLAEGRLVGDAPSQQMRSLLLRQQINDRLPALLPMDARVAHKTGELPDVRNDVGIVYASRATWAVAVLSQGVDGTDATNAIASLSRRLYDYFQQAGR